MAEVTEVNEGNFEALVLKADKPVLVDFWAAWCGPCRMMHPVLEGLNDEYGDKAVILKCNVDDNSGLAGRYNVSAIPTLIVFKDGEPVNTLIGVNSAENLKSALDAAGA